MIYLYSNIASNATISLSGASADGGTYVDNVVDNRPSHGLLTDAITTQYLKFAFSGSVTIDAIHVENISLTATDTLVLETSNDDFSSIVDTVALTPRTHSGYYAGAGYVLENRKYAYSVGTLTAQYFRLKMIQAAGAGIFVGEVYLAADAYTDTINYASDHFRGRRVNRVIANYPGGSTYRRVKGTMFFLDGIYSRIDSTQLSALQTISMNDYIVALPDLTLSEAFFSTFDISDPIRHDNTNRFSIDFKLQEST